MKVRFDKSFYKDLSKISDKSVAIAVTEIISEIEVATTFTEIRNLKKMKGYINAFRLRLGDYRIGILIIEQNTVDFIRILSRKDIYKYFP